MKASETIYNEAWRAKFTISPVVLEHSGRSRFLLMLQARDLKFLEHSFFAKNVAKRFQALSLQLNSKLQISC